MGSGVDDDDLDAGDAAGAKRSGETGVSDRVVIERAMGLDVCEFCAELRRDIGERRYLVRQ